MDTTTKTAARQHLETSASEYFATASIEWPKVGEPLVRGVIESHGSNQQSTDKSSDGLLQPESFSTLHVAKRQVVVNEVLNIARWSHLVLFERMRCGGKASACACTRSNAGPHYASPNLDDQLSRLARQSLLSRRGT
jgi:hypothetical protein